MKITITMDDNDFTLLTQRKTSRWAPEVGGNEWRQVADQFEALTVDEDINWAYRYVYWVGDDWLTVKFACAYLAAQGYPSQVLRDTTDCATHYGYAIITDYANEDWTESGRVAVQGLKSGQERLNRWLRSVDDDPADRPGAPS